MPRLLYVPVGLTGFEIPIATQLMGETLATLRDLAIEFDAPAEILTSPDTLDSFLRTPAAAGADLVVFQTTTFVGSNFIDQVIARFAGPVVVWAVREPEVGRRLRLNSLTGANSACHTLRTHGRNFAFWFGNPSEPRVQRQIQSQWRALRVVTRLAEGMKIGIVGEPPPGFTFCSAEADPLRAATGVELVRLNLAEIFREAENLPESAWSATLDRTATQVRDLPRTAATTIKYAKVATRLLQYSQEQNIGAMAIRCWPEFFTEFGAAACSTLSFLTEQGIASSCESDIHGALSMFIGRELSGGQPPYLGDLVHLDESANSVVFWHCGAGAFSLADKSTGARAGGHPNNGVGLTLEFGLKSGPVTICRLSRQQSKFRMLILEGEALDSPQRFYGTTVEVRLPGDALATMSDLMLEGYEPHYALVHADIVPELTDLCRLLGLEYSVYANRRPAVAAIKHTVPATAVSS